MPYTVAKNDKGEFCVYKADAEGKAAGETLGCHPDAEKAGAQIGAIEHEEAGRGKRLFMRAFRADMEPVGATAIAATADGPMRFVASTEGVKRDGLDLKSGDWRLDNYRRNPVFLWAHDYWGLPIGRVDVSVDGKRLIADVTFDRDDPFAAQVERKYRAGFLNAVSVGWDTREEGNDLLDISAVPVPGDPDALKLDQVRALTDLLHEVQNAVRGAVPDRESRLAGGVDDMNADEKPAARQVVDDLVTTALADILAKLQVIGR